MITKDDKLRILELALLILENKYTLECDHTHKLEIRFMCVAIESAASELGLRNDKTAIQLIPELLKYKPPGRKEWCKWFPEEDVETRIKIIKEIINDLK